MRTSFLHLLLLIVLSVTCYAGGTDTNLVDTVLAQAEFQDVDIAKLELADALKRAVLVVRATVTDSNATVEASPKQNEVSTGQGWKAASLQPMRVLKGTPEVGVILVENMGRRAGPNWRWPVEAANGQTCVLILERDDKLSRWCQTNVYEVIEGMEVKGHAEPADASDGSQPSRSDTNRGTRSAGSRR